MASSAEVWLWLLLVLQPANKATSFILKKCGGDALQAARNIRDGKYDFLSDNVKKNAERVRTREVRAVMELCEKHNIRIVTMDDSDYPAMLRGIDDPPIVLFCAGDISYLNENVTLAVVGTRNVSDYGVRMTHSLIEPVAGLGVTVVSGLAVGADAEAHRACMAGGGRTVGVLGCGILVNYPTANAQLKRDIIANGGAVISELLPNTKPHPSLFPVRNRIISGLSMGTLVIEADAGSGSLLTAQHAVKQGREVLCVPPHDLLNSHYLGVVPLLRDGAVSVYSYTDILMTFLRFFTDEKYIRDYIAAAEKAEREPAEPKKRKKSGKEKTPPAKETKEAAEPSAEPKTLSEKTLSEVGEREGELLKLIAKGAAKTDDLAEACGAEYNDIIDMLTTLEIDGYITRRQDGNYVLA